MSYLKIPNLYRDKDILLFRDVFAMEKLDGTSSHISFDSKDLRLFSGGSKHEDFVKLFDAEKLLENILVGVDAVPFCVTIYGEAYGGRIQGCSEIYGKSLKFTAFEVKINDKWLSVQDACDYCTKLQLDFVDFVKIPTTLEAIDEQRDRESIQAIKNGMGPGKLREGIILRPLIEVCRNNGSRIIAKHKQERCRETKTKREVTVEQQQVLSDAQKIAEEYVVLERLKHVFQQVNEPDITKMSLIIDFMIKDIQIEAGDEIVWTKEAGRAIGTKTAQLTKQYFADSLKEKV